MTASQLKRQESELHRVAAALEVKFARGGAEGSFSGYGAVFGNVDSVGDVLVKGAFQQSLREWNGKGRLPPMLLQHGGFLGGADDLLPIGKWLSMEEDDRGLKVEGQLIALDTDRGRYIHEGLKSGALAGLSIGYRAKEFTIGARPGEARRTLKQVHLAEVSIVTSPANDLALVTGAKSVTSAREFEDFLRRHGFAKAAAQRLTAGGWPALTTKAQPRAVADFFRKATAELKKD